VGHGWPVSSTFKEMMSTCWCVLATAVLAEQTLKRDLTEGFITYDQVRATSRHTRCQFNVKVYSHCMLLHACMGACTSGS
jgi:hypothetical protein